MTTKVCDCCKKEVDNLYKLVDEYMVEDVSEVCDDCLTEIDDLLLSCQKAIRIKKDNFIRNFIRRMSKTK